MAADGEGSHAIETETLFVFIGAAPHTDGLVGVEVDDRGFVPTGTDLRDPVRGRAAGERAPYPLETSVSGVFAVGDVRSGSVKRVASAAGEGAMAVSLAHCYLDDG